MSARQFTKLRAASLHCVTCGTAMPVREKLLLVLPEKELYDYLCTGCGTTVGQREVRAAEQVMRQEATRHPKGPQVRLL